MRIAPNYLAVDGAIAFPQIFQHRPGRPEWQKQRGFYHDHDELSLIGGTDDVHRRLRRQLAYAFSDSSMYEQEPVVTRYIDQLVGRLGERAADGGVFNLVHWFNFTTFDIIGDLMFADSFHSLDGGDYHPWVLNIIRGARGVALRRVMKLYPFMKAIISGSDIKRDDEIQQMAAEKAMARKAQGETPGGRRDFMTYMLKKNRDGGAGFSDFEIIMNSPLLVNAGSETTATTLTSLFYHLGKKENRAVYEHLTKEIREAFQNKDDIDMKTTNRLPYLHAVIEEALRIYPPAAETPPRVSPGAEVDGKFIPKGVSAPDTHPHPHSSPSLLLLVSRGFSLPQYPVSKPTTTNLTPSPPPRPSSSSTSSRPTATRPTSPSPTPSGRSGGCRPRTRSTTPSSPATTARASGPSASARATASARTSPTRSCASPSRASCCASTTSSPRGRRTRTGSTRAGSLSCGRSRRSTCGSWTGSGSPGSESGVAGLEGGGGIDRPLAMAMKGESLTGQVINQEYKEQVRTG